MKALDDVVLLVVEDAPLKHHLKGRDLVLVPFV